MFFTYTLKSIWTFRCTQEGTCRSVTMYIAKFFAEFSYLVFCYYVMWHLTPNCLLGLVSSLLFYFNAAATIFYRLMYLRSDMYEIVHGRGIVVAPTARAA